MEQSKQFEALVAAGNPVGEIIGIDSFLVKVKGLQPTNVHAVVRLMMIRVVMSTMSTRTMSWS